MARDVIRGTRRRFLAQGAAGLGIAGAGATFARRLAAALPVSPQGANDKVRMGFIGVGGRGTTHLRTILDVPGNEVTWVCDIDPTHLDAAGTIVKDKTGKRPSSTESHKRVLEAKDVDAVLIATPCDVHAALYLDAIAAGKDLYAEKPLCITVKEANAIVAAAEKSKSIVEVGFQNRYNPRAKDGIERAQRGDLGQVIELRAAFLAQFGPLRGWQSKRARSGDWMVEQAVHYFDMMNWTLGALPVNAFGRGRTDVYREGEPDRDVHDYYTAILEYPGGVVVNWLHSWLCPKGGAFNKHSIHIMGRKGAADLIGGGVEWMDAARPAEKLAEEGGNTTRFAQEAFLNCVRTRKTPFSNVKNGRDAVLTALVVREAVYGRRIATMEEVLKQGEG